MFSKLEYKDLLESLELRNTGLKWINGGDVIVDITEITEDEIIYTATLIQNFKREVYTKCFWNRKELDAILNKKPLGGKTRRPK